MAFEPQKAHGIKDLIITVGRIASSELEKTEDKEQYAFILGHMHFAAFLTNALDQKESPAKLGLSFNYKAALETYKECEQEYKEKESQQISMEELYPEIFKAVDAYLEKKNKPKKTTNKE